MEKITIDTIINFFEDNVKSKTPIAPHFFIDGSVKLNILRGDEDDLIFELQQKVSQRKVDIIESGKSVSQAKVMIEASDEYKQLCKQKARCERITEFIRLGKIMSKLKSDEMSGY